MLGKPEPYRPRDAKTPMAAPVQSAALQKGSKRYARMNSLTGRLLVALVVLSAVPVASNRPAWWLLVTFLIGLGALVYLVRAQYLMGARRSLQIGQMKVFFGLALVVPAYAIVQSLPLASLFPAGFLDLPAVIPTQLWPDTISIVPDASLLGAIRAMGFLIFLMLVIEVGTQPVRSHTLVLFLALGIVAHAVFGLVALRVLDDFALWGDKTAYQGVLTGTFVNRNSFATFLGFGLILALALALDRGHRASQAERDRGHKALLTPERLEIAGLWAVVLVLALAIALTESRMGVFATAVGATVTFLALRIRFGTSFRRIVIEALMGLSVIMLILMSNGSSGVTERALFTLAEGENRLAIYQITLTMIAERPLTGFGYDAFAAAFQLYRADPLVGEFYYDLAHNTFLGLWSEQGLVIGSIPILLSLWAMGIIVNRLRNGEGDFAVLSGALGVICLGGVHSLADFSLEIPANVLCYLLIVGLAIARERAPVQNATLNRLDPVQT